MHCPSVVRRAGSKLRAAGVKEAPPKRVSSFDQAANRTSLGRCDRDTGNVESSGREPLVLLFVREPKVGFCWSVVFRRTPPGDSATLFCKSDGDSNSGL